MQILLSAVDMSKADRLSIDRYKIPGVLLMENAGRAFVDVLSSHMNGLRGLQLAIVCGKGNNGGDGFVIARQLINRGCAIDVLLCTSKSQIVGDAKTNLESLVRLAREASTAVNIRTIRSRKDLAQAGSPDVIIDALFGTGFRGRPSGLMADVIAWINEKDTYVASVDIPSGVDASTGRVEGFAVEADLTITMASAKIGHYCGAGMLHSGEVVVVDISIPQFLIHPGRAPVFRLEEEDVRAILPRRSPALHKYSAGKVFLLAGSRNFTGAACLAAEAVLRSGAGAVMLGIPRSIHPIIAKKLTEVVIVPLDEHPDGSISRNALPAIRERIAWADAVAIGPGLSRNEDTLDLVREIFDLCEKPLIVDADAIAAFHGQTSRIKKRKSPTIFTPHTGEMAGLIGRAPTEVELSRIETSRDFAVSTGSIVVLKGAPTAIANPDGEVILNSTGNPGMATVGSGDVLTGVIAGFCAQSISPPFAAMAGVWTHGRAGDLAAGRLGQRSVLAGDILNEISSALNSVGVQ